VKKGRIGRCGGRKFLNRVGALRNGILRGAIKEDEGLKSAEWHLSNENYKQGFWKLYWDKKLHQTNREIKKRGEG
jgi:hypothetical protein